MKAIFAATGSGYQDDRTFDDYDVIAEPLPTREDRIFRRKDGGADYGSHSIKLARRKDFPTHGLFILMEHGSGRRVLQVRKFYDGGALENFILAMPEREQYALLYTLFHQAEEAADIAASATRTEWVRAFLEKRIRKSRPKQGRVRVTIEQKQAEPENVIAA